MEHEKKEEEIRETTPGVTHIPEVTEKGVTGGGAGEVFGVATLFGRIDQKLSPAISGRLANDDILM